MAKKSAGKKTKVEDNIRAIKFHEFLIDKGITVFSTESMEDEANTVFFRSRIEAAGQLLPVVVIIDASIFTIIRVQLAGDIPEEKRERLTMYLNGLNLYYKTFKYYMSPEGRICLDMCIPAKDEAFDAELVYGMLSTLVQHLQEHIGELMEAVWTR